jgi:hypothetical protein
VEKVTITVDEDVLRWAKVWAAEHDTSVSRMLDEELHRKMLSEQRYERARKRFQHAPIKALKAPHTPYPSRDSLYER